MILNSGDKRVGQRYQTSLALPFATRHIEKSRHCGGLREGGSKGQRKSPEQRQRPRRLREGQQGAKKVAGAEAEAAEVAGGGSKDNESRRSRAPAVTSSDSDSDSSSWRLIFMS